MIRFHLDAHVANAIADGLRRRGIDVTTAFEVNLTDASDNEHIEFARVSKRVIFTNDEDFLAIAARGVPHAGIVYCHQTTRTIGQIIAFLTLMDECFEEDDMTNHVEFA